MSGQIINKKTLRERPRNVFVASTHIKLRKTINLQAGIVNGVRVYMRVYKSMILEIIHPSALGDCKGEPKTVNKSVRKDL